MTKDYYGILGITYPSSPEEIAHAYKEMAKRWHPDLNPGKDVAEKMKSINEAAEVLRDPVKKANYDREYLKAFGQSHSAGQRNERPENAKDDMKDKAPRNDSGTAREKAEDFAKSFTSEFKDTGKKAAKGAWSFAKPFAIIFFAFSFLTPFCTGFIQGVKSTGDTSIEGESHYEYDYSPAIIPVTSTEGWKEYNVKGAFTIKVPPSVEMKHDYDQYVQELRRTGSSLAISDLIFEPKGISSMDQSALQHYCRVMITHDIDDKGSFLAKHETQKLSDEDVALFYDLVVQESSPFGLEEGPSFSWRTLPDDSKALEIKYRRYGTKGIVVCTLYCLFNDNQMARVLVTYREKEKDLWLPDLSDIISTFHWID